MDENTITTVFKADISQFSSSTQQLNQYIKTVNSEFDVATSSLGKWSDSTDGLTAKITQLNKVLEAEKMKLSDMKKRLEEMEKAGKGNTKEAKNLQIAINQQSAKIGKAEKQTDDYTKSLQELEKAGVKTKQELKELTDAQEQQGKSAEGIASKIGKGIGGAALGVAGMVTGAVGSMMGLAESTREFRKEQAQLETAFTQAGHSAETMKKTYSEFNSILGDTSKSQETMLHLAKFTKTEKELEGYTHALTGVFAEFGASLPTESLTENINLAIQTGDAIEGGLADALEWGGVNIDSFKEKLEACSTEEQRSQLILGKLTELYGESATAYKENNKDIIASEQAQTRLTQAMAELGAVAEPIMTMLKNLLSDVLEAIKPFVEIMGTGLKDALSGSSEGIKQFAEGLSGLIGSLVEMVNNMLPKVVEVILALIPTLIQTLVDNLPSIIQTIIDCVVQILNALSEMLPSLIPLIVDAILMIVDTILANLDKLVDAAINIVLALIDGINEAIPRLIDKIPEIISKLVRAIIGNLPKILSAGIQIVIKLAAGLIQAIPQLVEKIPELILAIVGGIMDGITDIQECGADLIKGLWEGIKNTGQWLWDKIKGFGQDIVDRFKKIFKIGSPSKVFADEIGTNLALGIGEGFDNEIGDVTKDMQRSMSNLTDDMSVDTSGVIGFNSNNVPSWVEKLFELIKNQNVINNYKFDYKFEKMATSKLALHKAALETKRAIGG